MKFWLDVVGLAANTLAAALLFRGSLGVPWSMQTWAGQSPQEEMFKRRTRRIAELAFSLLVAGFVLQLVARFF